MGETLSRRLNNIVSNDDLYMERLPRAMREESEDLAAACAVVYTILRLGNTDDEISIAEDLLELSRDLMDNLTFPDMVGRFCELVDKAKETTYDLKNLLGEKRMAMYIEDEIHEAFYIYDEWEYGKLFN